MIHIEHPGSISLYWNVRRRAVPVFRSSGGEGDARLRNKAQQRLRIRAETALRNDVARAWGSWGARGVGRHGATCWFKGGICVPGDRNENWYRRAGGGINQATEIATNFGRCRNGDRTLSSSEAIFIYAKEPEGLISSVIDLGQYDRSAERNAPIRFVVRVARAQHALVVRIDIIVGP